VLMVMAAASFSSGHAAKVNPIIANTKTISGIFEKFFIKHLYFSYFPNNGANIASIY